MPVAAKPGGPDAPSSQGTIGIDNLVQVRQYYNPTVCMLMVGLSS